MFINANFPLSNLHPSLSHGEQELCCLYAPAAVVCRLLTDRRRSRSTRDGGSGGAAAVARRYTRTNEYRDLYLNKLIMTNETT